MKLNHFFFSNRKHLKQNFSQLVFWCPCLARPAHLVKHSCSATPWPPGLLKAQSENHKLWYSPRALLGLLFQGSKAGRTRGQASEGTGSTISLCQPSQSSSVLSDGLFPPMNRGSSHSPLTSLWKKNFVPQIRTTQTRCSAPLMACWKILLEKKQDSKLLLADFCLTSVWHLGDWLPLSA